MPNFSQSACEELNILRLAYHLAVSFWMDAGGSHPDTMHLAKAVAAKKDLDEVARQLVDHRKVHGC